MDARLFDRREIKSPLQQFASDLCRKAGVRYRGLQSGFGIVADQVLVDNAHGSTLCVPLPELTVENLQQVVAASNVAWEPEVERLRR